MTKQEFKTQLKDKLAMELISRGHAITIKNGTYDEEQSENRPEILKIIWPKAKNKVTIICINTEYKHYISSGMNFKTFVEISADAVEATLSDCNITNNAEREVI